MNNFVFADNALWLAREKVGYLVGKKGHVLYDPGAPTKYHAMDNVGLILAAGAAPERSWDTPEQVWGAVIRKSADFSEIEVGEIVYIPGHVGIYAGDGQAVECTVKWAGGVQVTALLNHGSVFGLGGRRWSRHGRLSGVEYLAERPQEAPQNAGAEDEESAVLPVKRPGRPRRAVVEAPAEESPVTETAEEGERDG